MDTRELFVRFFRNELEGRALGSAYLGSGWVRVYADRQYYLGRHDRRTVTTAIDELKPLVADRLTIIDIGPGTADAVNTKTVPLVKMASSAQTVVLLDIKAEFARGAADIVASRFPSRIVRWIEADAFDTPPGGFGPRPLFLLTGGTAGNLPFEHDVPGVFPWIHRLLQANPDARLLVSFDVNRNPRSLLRAYANASLATSLIEYGERVLSKSGLRATQFEAFTEWDVASSSILLRLQAKKDLLLNFDGEPVLISAGQLFTVGHSTKLSDQMVRQYLVPAKATVVRTFRYPRSHVALYLIAGNGEMPR